MQGARVGKSGGVRCCTLSIFPLKRNAADGLFTSSSVDEIPELGICRQLFLLPENLLVF
jgi:hypothetical protein